jgi:hypothetical protein
MANRRGDAIYLGLLIVVSAIGFLASRLWPHEAKVRELPDFSPPPLEIELAIELPFEITRFEIREPPTLMLSDKMPTALSQVRSALLESSKPVEIRPIRSLASLDD